LFRPLGSAILDGNSRKCDGRTVPRFRCPACRRTDDHYPAGILTISGAFAAAHDEEIRSLARHVEAGPHRHPDGQYVRSGQR
jgi:hypothetical protein